jgi:arylsulfatase A-like enzyme
VGQAFEVSFFAERSGDMLLYAKPFWLWGTNGARNAGTGHGSPWRYDQHVPLFLQGAGVPRGLYRRPVDMADLAPTLAHLIGVGAPAGADGKLLFE